MSLVFPAAQSEPGQNFGIDSKADLLLYRLIEPVYLDARGTDLMTGLASFLTHWRHLYRAASSGAGIGSWIVRPRRSQVWNLSIYR